MLFTGSVLIVRLDLFVQNISHENKSRNSIWENLNAGIRVLLVLKCWSSLALYFITQDREAPSSSTLAIGVMQVYYLPQFPHFPLKVASSEHHNLL